MKFVFSVVFATLATVSLASTARAAIYTIDSSQSSITVSLGGLLGSLLTGQNFDLASLTTSYSGTIEATASASTITLLAGLSDIGANLNSVVAAGNGPATGGQFLPQEGNAAVSDDYPVGSPDGIYTPGEDNYGILSKPLLQ